MMQNRIALVRPPNYNRRSDLIDRRRTMMVDWADYIAT